MLQYAGLVLPAVILFGYLVLPAVILFGYMVQITREAIRDKREGWKCIPYASKSTESADTDATVRVSSKRRPWHATGTAASPNSR